MKIGYIGLGLMGKPCSFNLIKAGHSLHVWARRPETAKEVVERGARYCGTIAEVASRVEVLFLNVTNSNDVENILFADNGVIKGGKKGLIVVDMSTISAIATRNMAKRLKEHGIELVDAPVSGGTIGAVNGTLTIMVGASEEIFDRVKPLLLHMGTTVTRIGDSGAGQVAKSCNQIIVTGNIMAVAEAFQFAKAAGVNPIPIREALLGGFAGSKILDIHGKRMLSGDYTPGFKTALHKKDMGIVHDIIQELYLEAPLSEMGLEILAKAVEAGYGDIDSSAIFKLNNTQ
ncbi:MAG: NAD(P)-dependent oxidoreductase [Desulfovibrio sp.]|jgi:2-hydroxy-3-oxopropionate reductase|nr:NAD(P)-dependent oxidoreductase [Desulfovibrio sp.]